MTTYPTSGSGLGVSVALHGLNGRRLRQRTFPSLPSNDATSLMRIHEPDDRVLGSTHRHPKQGLPHTTLNETRMNQPSP